MTRDEIKKICNDYRINGFKINNDLSVDVYGDVMLHHCSLFKLPLKFNKVYGTFNCAANFLTSLENCPNYIESNFLCQFNNLTSLEYCPEYVGDDFSCIGNQINTLDYMPYYVGDEFYLSSSKRFTMVDKLNFNIQLKSKGKWKF